MTQIDDRIRVLRVIGRLNLGGPAIQAITLTRELGRRGYGRRGYDTTRPARFVHFI